MRAEHLSRINRKDCDGRLRSALATPACLGRIEVLAKRRVIVFSRTIVMECRTSVLGVSRINLEKSRLSKY
jgi:hypothetical protein